MDLIVPGDCQLEACSAILDCRPGQLRTCLVLLLFVLEFYLAFLQNTHVAPCVLDPVSRKCLIKIDGECVHSCSTDLPYETLDWSPICVRTDVFSAIQEYVSSREFYA